MRREKTQISKIRNEKGEITNTKEIQEIIRDYFEIEINWKNLEEMDTYLETCDYPKLK
jgi:hypothetical protein